MSEDLDQWVRRQWRMHGVEIWGSGLESGPQRRMGWKGIRARWGWSVSRCKALSRYVCAQGPPTSDARVEVTGDDDAQTVTTRSREVRTLDDLLDVAEVDRRVWRVARWRANVWHQASRTSEGRVVVTPLHQVRADLERKVVDQVEPLGAWHEPMPRDLSAPTSSCAVIVPDSQHGYRWSADKTYLDPLHDRRALDVATQLIARLQPEVIVLLGDMLDLGPWSTKYPRPVALRDTTTPALRELHWQLAQWRASSPGSRIVFIEGNHEARIARALSEKLDEASVTRAVGSDAPLGSVPHLLALGELGVEYVGPYGAGWWLWHAVHIVHGTKLRLSATLSESTSHVVMGHIHRVARMSRTIDTASGRRSITGICAGCMCRTDGSVPGFPGAPDWQQGIGLAWRDGDEVHLEAREIRSGALVYDGVTLRGADQVGAIAEATGYRAMRPG
jgi:hypothetical protein